MKPEAISSLSGEVRHAICHKLYTDWILGSEFYPTKYCYLWPFSFKEWCNSQENNWVYSDSALNSFNLHNNHPVYTCFRLMHLPKLLKISQQSNRKWIYNKQGMFMGKFYPIEKKFYTDIIRASMTNSMSVWSHTARRVFLEVLALHAFWTCALQAPCF